jgi:hypothetical protein
VALNPLGSLWRLARQTEDLFKLQATVAEALAVVDDRLTALEDRMVRLETGADRFVSEARAAATAAATMVASAVISDTITRVTRLEEAAKRVQPGGFRLPSPGDSSG